MENKSFYYLFENESDKKSYFNIYLCMIICNIFLTMSIISFFTWFIIKYYSVFYKIENIVDIIDGGLLQKFENTLSLTENTIGEINKDNYIGMIRNITIEVQHLYNKYF